MDLYIPAAMRQFLASIVTEHGWDALLKHLCALAPTFGLYAVSKDWINGPYLLKARGVHGDLLIWFTGAD